jgi:hypothetical protein
MKTRTIWTRNVLTGIPHAHKNAQVDMKAGTASYEEDGGCWTLWGGFFLTRKAAEKESRECALYELQRHKAYAERLYAACGLAIV